MNRDKLEGSWRQATGVAKERLGILIGAPLLASAGRRDRLAGLIQERRGDSHEEATRQLTEFMRRNRNWHLLNR